MWGVVGLNLAGLPGPEKYVKQACPRLFSEVLGDKVRRTHGQVIQVNCMRKAPCYFLDMEHLLGSTSKVCLRSEATNWPWLDKHVSGPATARDPGSTTQSVGQNYRGPKNDMNMRIVRSGSKAEGKGDSKNHGLYRIFTLMSSSWAPGNRILGTKCPIAPPKGFGASRHPSKSNALRDCWTHPCITRSLHMCASCDKADQQPGAESIRQSHI